MAETEVTQAQGPLINVVDQEGNIGSVPQAQLAELGDYVRPASNQEVLAFQNIQKHGTGLETAKGLAEQFAQGVAGPLATGAETKIFGVKPEAIKGREEALAEQYPGAGTAAQIAGLGTSAFIPGGQARVLGKAGQLAAKAVGLGEAATTAAKIGSSAVKMAAENALFQAGDETSKMFTSDTPPAQAAASAALHIGLAGIMGAAGGAAFTGVVSPLWKATIGDRLGGYLEAIQRRTNGEGLKMPESVSSAIERSGIEVPPEIKTAISQDPELQKLYTGLQESTTAPGIKAQEGLATFRKDASDNVVKALGKTPEEITTIEHKSPFEMGSEVQEALSKEIDKTFRPISEEFNGIREKFSKIPLTAEDDVIADKLVQLADKNGWNVPSLPQTKMLNETLSDLPHIKTLEDLRQYQSNLWGKAGIDPKMLHAAGQIVGALRDVETTALERAAGAQGADTLMKLQLARTAYGEKADLMQALNERLHAGKFRGPESFAESIKEMKPEEVLSRLSKGNDAGLIDLLQKNFPGIAQEIKTAQINKLLAQAASKAPEGHAVNSKTLFNAIDKMTPEMRRFILPEGAEVKINATKHLLESLPDRMNPSGTAKTLDMLMSKAPATAMGLLSWLTGHGPGSGVILGSLGRWVGRDAPDAIKLAFLKFLGHSGPVNSSAFKLAVDYAMATAKGQTLLNKATKALFKSGTEVFPKTQFPSERVKKQLDEKVKEAGTDPTSLMDSHTETAYYLPDHGSALSATAARATTYLNSIRPKTEKLGILDSPRTPSDFEKGEYDRALTIAQQPLVVLQSVKDGTITPKDVTTLKTIYPDLYISMTEKIMSEMTDHLSKDNTIPYTTKIGLSLFLAQPLDATMSGMSIAANQPTGPQQPQSQQKPGGGPHSMKALSKFSAQSQTPDQNRSARRAQT